MSGIVVPGNHQSTPPTLSWRIRDEPGLTVVEFSGELNETVELAHLRRRLKGSVFLHLGGVRRINSTGVREWVNFMRDLTSHIDVTLTHCSPAVIMQLNMVYNFCGKAQVRSFFAPYVCSCCDRHEDELINVKTHLSSGDCTQMPEFHCRVCGGAMEFDDIVDHYLGFLKQS